jgi:protocatechuate 3,4-dioxygenase beta subunit
MNTRDTALQDHDAPLADVVNLLSRRKTLAALAGGAFVASPLGTALANCAVIPSETGGPFPGDGTNGPNALTQSGVVRSDMRASFAGMASAVAAGVPLNVQLTLVNTDNSCARLSGYALYLWHCDGLGNYSLYGSTANQNYLRAVQAADSNGVMNFVTIVPGTYPGRWPHMHFEIYSGLAAASSGRSALRTSQLALPEDICRASYAAQPASYTGSVNALNNISLARDGIFADGVSLQMATVTGNDATGYTATLTIGIAAGAGVGVPPRLESTTGKSVEYYNSTLDHYVVVSDANEIAVIDAGGAGPGWSRTGQTFSIPAATDTTTSFPVYRFYGSVSPGPNSHFYTINESERAQLVALAQATPAAQKRWNYEGVGFRAGLASNGGCPVNVAPPSYSVPVYRLYNNGFPNKDSNHRYTTSTTVVQEMQAKGWALEGVAFCALAN